MSATSSSFLPAALSLAILGSTAIAGHSTEGRPRLRAESLPVSEPPEILAEPPLIAAADGLEAPAGLSADLPSGAAPARPVSESVTINLINRLVERGVLTKQDSSDLLKMAETDAAQARLQAAEQQQAAVRQAVSQAVAAAQLAIPPALPSPESLAPDDGTVRVTYIPEVVKAQIRDEIRDDLRRTGFDPKGSSPGLVPPWVQKIRLFGDIRTRYQGDYFPDGNANKGEFPNFNAINTGAPFDLSGTQLASQLNVDQNRDRFRLRLRVGLEAQLENGFSIGLRLATGETNTPVSTNQTLGLANNAQGGNFSKYAIWLDRAFLKYEAGAGTDRNLSVLLGRFDNPFFSSEVAFDEDVGFDGVAILGKYGVGHGVTPYLTLGAFPIFNTDFNFSNTQPAKFKSTDKYLYAGQIGTDWQISKDFHLKLGAAYYYFDKVEGRLSDPFVPLSASDQGNTDDTRPSFAQKGNTYRPLRNIIPTAANGFGTTNQFQYFGLAAPFHELALTARLDYTHYEPFKVSLFGEYIKNLAFSRGDIEKIGINNRASSAPGTLGSFDGGDTAWIVDLRAGSSALDRFGKWAVGINYRSVGSDAVLDALTESDFGGGGTNLQGYTIYGVLALSPNVTFGVKWLSAREIAGPPLRQDTLEVDISGHF